MLRCHVEGSTAIGLRNESHDKIIQHYKATTNLILSQHAESWQTNEHTQTQTPCDANIKSRKLLIEKSGESKKPALP
jgi:hypothetical protein